MTRQEVYRNLHKDMWSIRDARTKKVVAHRRTVVMRDVVFRVSKAGRERVLREKAKNVHAFVVGDPIHSTTRICGWFRIRYNPYRSDSFVDERGNPVVSAFEVSLHEDGAVYATGIVYREVDTDADRR